MHLANIGDGCLQRLPIPKEYWLSMIRDFPRKDVIVSVWSDSIAGLLGRLTTVRLASV